MDNKKVMALAVTLITAATVMPKNAIAAEAASYVRTDKTPKAVRQMVTVQAANSAAQKEQKKIDEKNAEEKNNEKEEDNKKTDEENKENQKDKEKEEQDNKDKEDKEDYEKQKDGKKLNVTNMSLSSNKKRIEGRVKNHQKAKISIYFEGEKVGSGSTDKKGSFSVSLDKRVEDNSDLEVFAGTGKGYSNKTKNSTDKEVEAKSVSLKNSDKTIVAEFKNLKNTDVKIYYDGKHIGTAKTDSDSTLEYKHDKKIKDKEDLEFYIAKEEKKDNEHKNIFVTKALPRTNTIEGTATAESKVEVKTAIIDVKIGEGKADKDGNFKITLNRELIPGERIIVRSFVDDKETAKTEYNVPESYEDKKDNVSKDGSGYIKGYEDGSFKPENKVTRAEASLMFARLINGSDNFTTSDVTKFKDANNEWYSKGINFAINESLINGYEDGTFRPNENITRAEFANIVASYIKNDDIKVSNLKDIEDHWAKNAINKVYSAGYIKGYEDNTFKPNNEITRAEAVTILNAVFNVKADKDSKVSFTDVESGKWYYEDVLKAAK